MLRTLLFIALSMPFHAFASTDPDKSEVLSGVKLETYKENSTRIYLAALEKELPFPIDEIKASLTNFTERCNNDLKNKREFTNETHECKYHDEKVVESFVVKDLKPMDYFKEMSEVYLVGQKTYDRVPYQHYSLVTVQEGKNEKDQRTITIQVRMLNDKEVKLYTSPLFKRDSLYKNILTTYVLTPLANGKTLLKYKLRASTRHWLLNKEILVPQVFASFSKRINELVKIVENESGARVRGIASNQ